MFFISGCISLVYVVFKMIEAKYSNQEKEKEKPLKHIVQDALLVYFSSLLSFFIIKQVHQLSDSGQSGFVTKVYVDDPNF